MKQNNLVQIIVDKFQDAVLLFLFSFLFFCFVLFGVCFLFYVSLWVSLSHSWLVDHLDF